MADEATQGVEAFNLRAAGLRQEAAYNALRGVYGDIAGDPDAALKMQSYTEQQQEFPLKLQTEQRANTAGNALVDKYGPQAGDPDAWVKAQEASTNQQDQQRLAGYRALKMLQDNVDPKTGAVDGAAYDKLVGKNADMLGLSPDHVSGLREMVTQPGGAQHLDTIEQALLGPVKMSGAPTYGVGPDGKPVLIQRDQYGNPNVTGLGDNTPVAVTNAAANTSKAASAAENANTGAFRANTYAANQTFGATSGPAAAGAPAAAPAAGGGISPQTIEAFVAKHGGNVDAAIQAAPNDKAALAIADYYSQKAKANGGGAAAAPVEIPPAIANLPMKGRQMAINAAQSLTNQATNLTNMNTLLDSTERMVSPFTAGTGSLLKDLPGSAQANLKANLATLKAQGLTAWINSLKNGQGQTGIGRVLQSEANAASQMYGNMEQDQSAKQLAFHLKLFRNSVNQLFTHAQAAYKAQWGVDPYSAIGMTPPTTQPNAPPAQAATKTYSYDPKTGLLQ